MIDPVLRFAAEQSADGMITVANRSPGFVARRRAIERQLDVTVLPEVPFVDPPTGLDLRRFARYWRRVERSAMAPTRHG
jgi:deoxyribodipyrimidine photo-lyase